MSSISRAVSALCALCVLAGLSLVGASPAQAYAGAPWFEPGKVYTENFPDPDVLRVGDRYYAYGTATGGAYLPVMSSTDLRTWTARRAYDPGAPLNEDPFFNDALPYPAKWGADRPVSGRMTKAVWAPGVERIGGQYVAFYTLQARTSPERYCISVATSSSPEGPFRDTTSAPLQCDADPKGSIDPDPFIDPATGKAWLIWKSEGVPGSQPTKIWVRELSASGTSFAAGTVQREILRTSQSWEGNVIENPSMIRSQGQLYLFYSGNEWASGQYATGYATCRSVTGPCTKARSTPLLASSGDRLGTGGGVAFHDGAGRLQLSYHHWTAPYTSYPAYPQCEANDSCTTQGQRRLAIADLSGSGTSLRLGATPELSGPSRFQGVNPARILDTRTGLGAPKGVLAPRSRVELQVGGRGGVPVGASAVTLNVTLAGSSGPGFVQAYPTGRGVEGASSNLNADHTGQVIANLVTVPLGVDGKVSLYTAGGGHLLGDVTGYYVPATTSTVGRYQSLAPARILDTRSGTMPGPGSQTELQVTGRGGVPASGVSAVALNVTATRAARSGYVQVVPTGGATALGASSNLNVVAGQTVANMVIVPVGRDGRVTLYSSGGTHLVADVAGWYTDQSAASASSGLLVPVSPTRLADTRISQLPGAGAVLTRSPLPQLRTTRGASAVVVSVTAVNPERAGHVQVLPAGGVTGGSSNLNIERAGQTIANAALGSLSPDDRVSLYTLNPTHLLMDVSGYFTE